MAKVNLEKPGCLIYRSGNFEYTFPCFEENNETVVVDSPTHLRVYLFFGWYTVPTSLSPKKKEKIRSCLHVHFRKTGKTLRFFETPSSEERSLAFHGELFEHRSIASTLLEEKGFVFFSDYTSIDILHDEYGLDICGISNESKVATIAQIMRDGFPQWHFHGICRNAYGRDPGWKFSIHMFRKGCGGGRCAEVF